MQSSHVSSAVAAEFDEPNLIADAGLVPVVRLAERAGLPELAAGALRIDGARNSAGAAPAAKVMSLVAAMCAGADSIDDTDRLPCLATVNPAPATTKAVVVEILNVCRPSPPVPQVSTINDVPTVIRTA